MDRKLADAYSFEASASTENLSMAERSTLTNEAELEAARVMSSRESSPPAPSEGRGTLLTLVNGHVSSRPPNVPARLPLETRPDSSRGGSAPSARPMDPVSEIQDRLAMGDYTGALTVADRVPSSSGQYTEAVALGMHCRTILLQMHRAKVGSFDQVPFVLIERQQLRWLSLDHRAGFLLSLMDGRLSVQEVVDTANMPELEVLRVLYELLSQGVVALR